MAEEEKRIDSLEEIFQTQKQTIKQLTPKELAAYGLLLGVAIYCGLFLFVLFVLWFIKGGNQETLEIYLHWVQVLREVCLPVLTLLLGYLFGVRRE